ncbi:MAG: trigger factor [Lachnospiraceae bacterium]
MSLKVEKLEGNMAKLTIEVEAEKFEECITRAYNKMKNRISVPGFRKGKVPQKRAEMVYGVEIFYEDAVNFAINDTYADEVKDCELEIVSAPEIDTEQIERGKNFIYTALVAIKPEVTLGKYKGLEYTEFSVEVTEDDINSELERAREMNSRKVEITDRPAEEGDTVYLAFDGYVDGKQFDGGKADNYSLVLGSHSFIDTFEDQVAGHNVGDEFDVNVTFPEVYQSKELEGKPAVFKCKINKIERKELPELDDEFASEVSEFETLEEYRADLAKTIEDRKRSEARAKAKEELIQKAAENAQMTLPDAMINEQSKILARQMQMNLQQYGIGMEQYLRMINQSPEEFIAAQRPYAVKTIKGRLTLEAIAQAEGLLATEEDVNTQLQEMAEAYHMEIDKVRETVSAEELEDLEHDIAANKASDFLLEKGKAVPAPQLEEDEKSDKE